MSETPDARPFLLLVEDDAPLATVMAGNLQQDYEVDVANNADEARMMLATRQYDAIISDHMMPGRTQGLDFLIEASRIQPSAKRILLTGYLNPELISRSIKLGSLSACLLKPIEIKQLRQELHQLLSS